MEFSGTSGVPQGNLIFYPVDYKAFIDTLYDYTDGTPSDLVLQSERSADKSELSAADTALQNAIGGTLRQCLCVKESLDFDDTDFVDLDSLTFSSTAYGYSVELSAVKSDGKALATEYKYVPYSEFNTNHTLGTFSISAHYIGIATNEEPKGLLAYEKASE